MPFFTPEPDPGLRTESAGLPPLPPYDPKLVMDAALRQDNTVVSAIHAMRNSGAFAPEPGHNPLDVLGKGSLYEQRYLDRFAGSESTAETRHIMGLIDGELADKRILEGAGTAGVVAQMIAGTLDPTLALPGGVAVQAGKEGLVFTRAAARVGLAAGVQSGVQESVLHATQQTRTVGESLLNVGSATLLGALLGGAAVKLLTPAERLALTGEMNRSRVDMDAHARGEPPPVGFEADHASPYEFEQFDLSKIGTGQGAQSYGRGIYLSTSPDVHAEYLKEFSQDRSYLKKGLGPNATAADYAAVALVNKLGSVEEARAAVGGSIEAAQDEMFAGSFKAPPNEIMVALDKVAAPAPPVSYKVRVLADREHFLDFDKSLSEQGPYVQEVLKRLGIDNTEGQSLVNYLSEKFGGSARASAALREAGIPGIKYLDAGSRASADVERLKAQIEKYKKEGSDFDDLEAQLRKAENASDTHNFVVFDAALLQVTHKNGQPLVSAAPRAANANAQPAGAAAADTRAPASIKYNPLEMARRGELTADRAVEISKEMQTAEKDIVDSVLGSDAEAWRIAHKRSDRAWDNARDAEARKQDKIVEDIEAKYPPAAIEEMYRQIEQGEHTDPASWRDFARDLRDVEGDRSDAVTTVGYTLRRLPSDPTKPLSQTDRETLALIQHALDVEGKRGGDPQAFLREAFQKSAERYGGGPDAQEIIASDMARLRSLLENPPPDRPALPAPPPAPVRAPEPSLAASVGAAAADVRALELVPTGVKLEQAPFDPLTRLVNSESPSSRRAAVDLAESPLEFKENLEGIPTTAGPALDRSARMAINQTRVAVSDQLHELWKSLRFGGEQAPWFARARDRLSMLDREPGLPTFEEFKALVSEALQNGDVHEIPQVQQAAQFIRQKVFDPWKERATAAKLLPEEVDVKTADSYLQRVYDKQKIAARRPEFVNTALSWMKSDQATKAATKDRIEGLNRRLQASKDRLAKLDGKAGKEAEFATIQQQHDSLRADIEREIAAWEGKTTGEAKAALKAREKAEGERSELQRQKQPRLEGADKAVDRAVRDIIESDRAVDDQELRDRAHEITEHILGSPDGRLPYDEAMGGPEIGYHAKAPEPPRGPLAKREFNIPDALIREFLESDVERIVNTHLKTMVPDVLLTERFGDVRMTEAFRKIEDDYARLIDQTKSEKERTRLGKEREKDLRDLAAIRDRIRGVYGMDVFNTMRGMARTAQAVKNYNVLTSMGMAAVSSLPDMAGAIFRWGLGTVFSDAWAPFAKSLLSDRALTGEATRQFRAMGIAVETFTAQRHHSLTDIMEGYRPQSRVERTLQWGADKFQLLNMLGPWTDMGKIIASTVASQELFRAAEAVTKGAGTKKQVRALAANGIDSHMAGRIAEQYAASGNKVDGVHLPNTADWTDLKAREAFEGAIGREADIAIVSPGQEKPLWLSNPVVNVLGQFKSFTASATQRILIANLQRRDAQVMQGLMFSMGLGMVSYKLNSMLGGQPTSDRPQDWIKESISRGSVLGWLEEGNALASKATRGGVDMYRMIGSDKPLSRYAGRSVIDQVLGPTAGKVDSLTKATGAFGSIALGKGYWNHADTSAIRKLTASQNLFYLRGLFNQVEQGANNAFGIAPKPEKKPH